MRVKVLLQITAEDGTAGDAAEVAVFEKQTERPEDLGLSIAEGKALMAAVQQRVVDAQVASWTERHRCCEACGARRHSKGSHPVVFLTLYGDVRIASPRLHRCPCQGTDGPATVSPLRNLIPDYVAPERLYLEARWASLVPYAAAAGLLADILPIAAGANATTLREHVLRVAERAEAELGEERPCFIDGCPADWARLPIPEGRIVVGLDGGYVRDWEDRKTNFEVIVGRSVPEDRDARYVGLVHGYDSKPKRRLFDVLKSQGLQANQDVTFLTDGGEEIRALTEFVTPESEHVLDWFHITMRLTVLSQYARGVAQHDDAAGHTSAGRAGTDQVAALARQSASCRTDHRVLPGRRGRAGGGLPQSAQVRPRRARICRLHRLERRQPDQLWRAIPRRRTYLVVPGRIHGERRHQQAFRQASADAVDEARCAPAAADPNAHARWHAPASLRAMVSRLANDNAAGAAQAGGVNTPEILMLSTVAGCCCHPRVPLHPPFGRSRPAGKVSLGWLPDLGTRGFHRPLSDPSTDLQVRCHASKRDGRDAPLAEIEERSELDALYQTDHAGAFKKLVTRPANRMIKTGACPRLISGPAGVRPLAGIDAASRSIPRRVVPIKRTTMIR